MEEQNTGIDKYTEIQNKLHELGRGMHDGSITNVNIVCASEFIFRLAEHGFAIEPEQDYYILPLDGIRFHVRELKEGELIPQNTEYVINYTLNDQDLLFIPKAAPGEILSVNTNQSQQADRHNEGKPQWSMVDFPSMEPMVRVLEFGANKYSRDNWKKGLPKEQILDSMMRHVFALASGEENDPESGLPHIGHIQCNAMFYAYMAKKEE